MPRSEYESVARAILWLLQRQPEAKINRRYLPDVLALLVAGKVRIIDDSGSPLIIGRPVTEDVCN